MANSHLKRKNYSRRGPYSSRRKKRSIVPIHEENDHAVTTSVTGPIGAIAVTGTECDFERTCTVQVRLSKAAENLIPLNDVDISIDKSNDRVVVTSPEKQGIADLSEQLPRVDSSTCYDNVTSRSHSPIAYGHNFSISLDRHGNRVVRELRDRWLILGTSKKRRLVPDLDGSCNRALVHAAVIGECESQFSEYDVNISIDKCVNQVVCRPPKGRDNSDNSDKRRGSLLLGSDRDGSNELSAHVSDNNLEMDSEKKRLFPEQDNPKQLESADESLIIESAPADKGRIVEESIEGRRIVDITFFMQQLHEKFDNHNVALQCPFSDLKLIKSLNRGLRTRVTFMCQMCNYKFNIWTDPDNRSIMGINESAVCGTITSGTGYSTLQEQLAAMSIPPMTPNTYRKFRNMMFENFHEVAEAEIRRAVLIETEMAIKKGHIINGVPYIQVVSDGCWAKRSYAGGKYDALSGAAMIFGRESKLALFVAVRNKYCPTHERAQRLNVEPPDHVCYKNWGREQSSTAMETNIIVEGFKISVEKNGLIYKTLISDGDSSVYQAIRDANPYAQYEVMVEKIECNNHLFRNLCRKLRVASAMKLKVPPTKGKMNVTELRQCVFASGLKIRKSVEHARDLRNAEKNSVEDKAQALCKDVLNICSHVFGEHSKCHTLPFPCEAGDNGKDVMAELHVTGLYPSVYEAVRYLSCHAKSLLTGVTNNMAEACNSIVNKLNSGKRINHCAGNSYQMRCYGAVVQHNTQSVLSKLHVRRSVTVPTTITKLENCRRLKNELNHIGKQGKRSQKHRKFQGADKNYGPSARQPDVDEDMFEILAQEHMNKLKTQQSNWRQIERDTVSQSCSDKWHQLRTEIITASRFGPICRMLPTTSCSNMVASIRYPKVIDTAATQFGRENEANARHAVESHLGKTIVSCGLFIDQEIPYLGASPDGLIDDDGIVEIKCPFTAQNCTLEHAIREKPNLRNVFNKKDSNSLNKSHAYFYQVQGQLHVTKRNYCIFAMWTTVDLKIITVFRDDDFWELKMKPILSRFYMECLLPEIIDSRRNRSMPIREPKFILRARKDALQKKSAKKPVKVKVPAESVIGIVKTRAESSVTPQAAMDVVITNPKNSLRAVRANWVEIESDEEGQVSDQHIKFLKMLQTDISVEEVVANVSLLTGFLTDTSIDLFQNILQENSAFRCNPATYTGYYKFIKPCPPGSRDLQIIGGNKFRHWCCLYYDGTQIFVYDSLVRPEYDLLNKEEKRYIHLRYPHVNVENVILQPVTKQPDPFSCGVYAAAFATTVALGEDPVDQTYVRNASEMRAHLVQILISRNLAPFPCE